MSAKDDTSEAVKAVEALMFEKYETEPFHNLYLLQKTGPVCPNYGGTCSDKTLSFLNAAKRAGFEAWLHSGFIDGKEIHRLARLHIEGRVFFADVGNGWPAVRLYPADQEIIYECFGMRFRTEVANNRVTVFHLRNKRESLQLQIPLCGRPESEIRDAIDNRFGSGIDYPFSDSLRFSLVVDGRFLFLRGERLEIYSDDGFEVIEGIKDYQVPDVILHHFQFDIGPLLSGAR